MTVDTLNGHHPQGRAAPPAPTYTFPGGQVATLHAVSQFTQASIEIGIRRAFPPPSPPLNEVDYGDGVKKLEPNPSDPEHEQALRRYQADYSQRLFAAIIDLAVDIEIDQAALERVKAMFERHGIPFDEPSDKVAYVKHCCIFDIAEEMPKFMAALRDLMGPKEEDVADHVATFPGDVSRSRSL